MAKANGIQWWWRGYKDSRLLWVTHDGDTAHVAVRVGYAPAHRTWFFHSPRTGRNTLIAGEKFEMRRDAEKAAVKWVKGELAADRPPF